MSISDTVLQSPKNRFLAVSGDATVGQAIAALQAEGGESWWHLLVRMDDGSWGATTFTGLYDAVAGTASAAEMRLGDQKGLATVPAVERDGMDTEPAQALARKSPGSLLVVTTKGNPVGILFERASRGALAISSSKLTDLGGPYINLKDYGAILLASSKRVGQPQPARPPAKA